MNSSDNNGKKTDRDTKGRFGKGNGGRPVGSSNKTSRELRAAIKSVLDVEIENLPKLLCSLSERDRVEFIVKLLPYGLPKLEPGALDIGLY